MAGIKRLPNGDVDYHEDFFAKPSFLTVSGQLQVCSGGGGAAAPRILRQGGARLPASAVMRIADGRDNLNCVVQ